MIDLLEVDEFDGPAAREVVLEAEAILVDALFDRIVRDLVVRDAVRVGQATAERSRPVRTAAGGAVRRGRSRAPRRRPRTTVRSPPRRSPSARRSRR
jgi:hypothetical protein